MSLSASWSGTKRMDTLPTATRGMTEKRVGPKRYDASRACMAITRLSTQRRAGTVLRTSGTLRQCEVIRVQHPSGTLGKAVTSAAGADGRMFPALRASSSSPTRTSTTDSVGSHHRALSRSLRMTSSVLGSAAGKCYRSTAAPQVEIVASAFCAC